MAFQNPEDDADLEVLIVSDPRSTPPTPAYILRNVGPGKQSNATAASVHVNDDYAAADDQHAQRFARPKGTVTGGCVGCARRKAALFSFLGKVLGNG